MIAHASQRLKQNLTELEIAMLNHMEFIVRVEGRTFSYRDFKGFVVNDRHYAVRHGTCRNKFSKFVKMGLIDFEIEFQGLILYTSMDITSVKSSMTHNHMGIIICHPCHWCHWNRYAGPISLPTNCSL